MSARVQPTLAERGKLGALKRWGPPRRHNLADLDPVHRERIEAFIEAERRAQEREQQAASPDRD